VEGKFPHIPFPVCELCPEIFSFLYENENLMSKKWEKELDYSEGLKFLKCNNFLECGNGP
jgi:hypothetical protein